MNTTLHPEACDGDRKEPSLQDKLNDAVETLQNLSDGVCAPGEGDMNPFQTEVVMMRLLAGECLARIGGKL